MCVISLQIEKRKWMDPKTIYFTTHIVIIMILFWFNYVTVVEAYVIALHSCHHVSPFSIQRVCQVEGWLATFRQKSPEKHGNTSYYWISVWNFLRTVKFPSVGFNVPPLERLNFNMTNSPVLLLEPLFFLWFRMACDTIIISHQQKRSKSTHQSSFPMLVSLNPEKHSEETCTPTFLPSLRSRQKQKVEKSFVKSIFSC